MLFADIKPRKNFGVKQIVILFSFLCSSGTSFSAENFDQFQKKINGLSVEKVTVTLVPKSWSFRSNLTEKNLLDVGCSYVTTDSLLIERLKDILSWKSLTINKEAAKFLLRQGIFFTLKNGTEVKLLLGSPIENTNLQTIGTLTYPPYPAIDYVYSSSETFESLKEWGQLTGTPIVLNSQQQRSCKELHS